MSNAACALKAAIAGGLTACLAAFAHAAPEMIVLSSSTYDSGDEDRAYALATDANGDIFIAGNSGNDYFFLKYNKNLQPGLPQIYSNGRSGNVPGGIAVDGFGNIVVAGMEGGPSASQDYLILKYSPNFSTLISSASYDGGYYDRATAVIMDEQSNAYVTGFSNDGVTDRFYTIKYDSLLNRVSTAAFDSGDMDQAYAMTFSGSDIIVAGVTRTGGTDDDIRLVRYDRNLNYLPPSVTFNSGGGDMAVGVAADSAGNIIVAARRVGANPDFLTLKYDSTLTTLISSAAYDSGGADTPKGVTVDSNDNIIVTGFTNIAGAVDFFTVKYDSTLKLVSTAAYDGGLADVSNAVSVDAEDNVIITGQSYTLTDNFFTVKYNASPRLTSVGPLYAGETANVTFIGRGLLADTVISFTDPSISTGAFSFNSGQITISVTPSASVTLGGTTVTVTNSNGEYFTSASLARTRLRRVIPAMQSASITAATGAGNVSVTVPAGSFILQETLTIYTEEAGGDAQQVGESLFIAGTPSTTSLVNMTITLPYRQSDLGGYPEASLSIGYYDPSAGWVPLPSSVNTAAKTVTGTSRAANNRYAVLKAPPSGGGGGGGAGGSGIPAKVYPSPYRPGSGGNFDDSEMGEGIVFAGMEPNQSFNLTIVDLAGQLVLQKSGSADSAGRYLWDTNTVSGGKAVSGVYLYILTGSGEPRKGKLAIIR